MLPVLLIHGYSSEGRNNTVDEIYGTLPADLRNWLGADNVRELDLSRWISLNDGITLDDVSFAMDRALKAECPDLLKSGFHVVIHSTGALVARNWIKKFSPKPSPIANLVHLAGANFGSGLAHIGKGQIARWGRSIAFDTGSGIKVLNELEFGSWKTLDLHLYFLREGERMFEDYQVQEFCIIGSQIPENLRLVPIRYIKEDSSDCTVRTSAGNLNFNHIAVEPVEKAFGITPRQLSANVEKRLDDKQVSRANYRIAYRSLSREERQVPFAVLYETAHFGEKIGIVTGSKNRKRLQPLLTAALQSPFDGEEYRKLAERFHKANLATFARAAKLDWKLTEWNPQSQYEGHAQLIFRVRDQNGNGVEHFDLTFKSKPTDDAGVKLESLIEDKHLNAKDKGTITFYLRTQKFDKDEKLWREQLDSIAPLDLEISGTEPQSKDIAYLPLNVRLESEEIRSMLTSFQTTVIDVTLLRLPSENVFAIEKR